MSESDCLCGHEGPDRFGNYDLLEHPDCPLHGAADLQWKARVDHLLRETERLERQLAEAHERGDRVAKWAEYLMPHRGHAPELDAWRSYREGKR